MKITIYTISSCPFSQQEKEYLKANNFSFEEKNLEENREWLTEMLTISNNFAGTPVTKIEDDQGEIHVLKGFTKKEFDKVLGLTPAEPEPAVSALNAQMPVPPPKQPVSPLSPKPPSPPPPPPVSPPSAPADPLPVSSTSGSGEATQPPQVNPQPLQAQDPALQSVLDNLKQNLQSPSENQPSVGQPLTSQPVTSQQATHQQGTNQPSSVPTDLPNIPDFPK